MSIRIEVESRTYKPIGAPVEFEPRVNVWATSASDGPTMMQTAHLSKDGGAAHRFHIPSVYASRADGELCVHLQAKTKIDPIEVNPSRYLGASHTTSAEDERHLRRDYYTTVARASVMLSKAVNGPLREAGVGGATSLRVNMASNTAVGTANVSPEHASRGEIDLRFTLVVDGDDGDGDGDVSVDDVLPAAMPTEERRLQQEESAYRKAMDAYRQTYNSWARSDADGGVYVTGPDGVVLDPDTPQMKRFHLSEWEVGVRGDALPYAEWWLGGGIDIARNVVKDGEAAEAFFKRLSAVAMRRAGVRSADELVRTVRAALEPGYAEKEGVRRERFAQKDAREYARLVRCVECLHYMLYEPVTASGYASDSRYVASRNEPRAHYAATEDWFAVPVESPEQDVAAGVSTVGDCDNLNIYAFYMNEAFRRGASRDATPETSPWADRVLAALWMLHTKYVQMNVLGSIPAHGNGGALAVESGHSVEKVKGAFPSKDVTSFYYDIDIDAVPSSPIIFFAKKYLEENGISIQISTKENVPENTRVVVPRAYNGEAFVLEDGTPPNAVLYLYHLNWFLDKIGVDFKPRPQNIKVPISKLDGSTYESVETPLTDLSSKWFSGPMRALRQLLTDQSPTRVDATGYGTKLYATKDVKTNTVFAIYDGIHVGSEGFNKTFAPSDEPRFDNAAHRTVIQMGDTTLVTSVDEMGHDTLNSVPGINQGTASYARHTPGPEKEANCVPVPLQGRDKNDPSSTVVVLVATSSITSGEEIRPIFINKTQGGGKVTGFQMKTIDTADYPMQYILPYRRPKPEKEVEIDVGYPVAATKTGAFKGRPSKLKDLHFSAKKIVHAAYSMDLYDHMGKIFHTGRERMGEYVEFINGVFDFVHGKSIPPAGYVSMETNKVASSLLSRAARIMMHASSLTGYTEDNGSVKRKSDVMLLYRSVLLFVAGLEKLIGAPQDDDMGDFTWERSEGEPKDGGLANALELERKYKKGLEGTRKALQNIFGEESKPSEKILRAFELYHIVNKEYPTEEIMKSYKFYSTYLVKSQLDRSPEISLYYAKKRVDEGTEGKTNEPTPSKHLSQPSENEVRHRVQASSTEKPSHGKIGRLIDSHEERRQSVTGHTFALHMTPATLSSQYTHHQRLMTHAYGKDGPHGSVVALAHNMARSICPDDPKLGLDILQMLPVRVGEGTGRQEPLLMAPDAYFEATSEEMVRREALRRLNEYATDKWATEYNDGAAIGDASEMIYTYRLPRHRYVASSYMEDGREEALSDFYRRIVHACSADLARADPRIRHMVAARPERRTFGVPLRHALDGSDRCLFMPMGEQLASTYLNDNVSKRVFERINSRRTPVTLPHREADIADDGTSDVSHFADTPIPSAVAWNGASSQGQSAGGGGGGGTNVQPITLKMAVDDDEPLAAILERTGQDSVVVERDYYLHPKSKEAIDRVSRAVERIFGSAATVDVATAHTVKRPIMVVTLHAKVVFEHKH